MLNANLEPDVYELLWLHVAPIASNLMCWLGCMQLCMQGSCVMKDVVAHRSARFLAQSASRNIDLAEESGFY